GDRPLLMLFNAEPRDTDFHLPAGPWHTLLDSSDDAAGQGTDAAHSGHYPLRARSVVLLAGQAVPFPSAPPRASA
ncbi:MAG: hypothetical protein CFE45_42995, partial [Burkholderiales bacterium PBB5]